jgi:hypothetical protein
MSVSSKAKTLSLISDDSNITDLGNKMVSTIIKIPHEQQKKNAENWEIMQWTVNT